MEAEKQVYLMSDDKFVNYSLDSERHSYKAEAFKIALEYKKERALDGQFYKQERA